MLRRRQQELHLAETTLDKKKGELAPLELRPLFEIIVGTARIIGSAVLNPPERDASGKAEKGMTAAWLVTGNSPWVERTT